MRAFHPQSCGALHRHDAVWEIGPPLQSCADRIDEIVALLRRPLQAEKYFMQMTHSGVIEIKGDRATARFVERERGRGESTYYDSLAVYEDGTMTTITSNYTAQRVSKK